MSFFLQERQTLCQIAVIQHRDLFCITQYQLTLVGQTDVINISHRFTIVQHKLMYRIGSGDERCGFEVHIHALRAILKKPGAAFIVGVVPVNEGEQGGMTNDVAGLIRALSRFVAHAESTSRIQRQPSITVRHGGPFRYRLSDDVIHRGSGVQHCVGLLRLEQDLIGQKTHQTPGQPVQ